MTKDQALPEPPLFGDDWIDRQWEESCNQAYFPALTHYTAAVARAALAYAPAPEVQASRAEGLSDALAKALERMDRARDILTDGQPRPECNWGMLATEDLRAAPSTPASPKETK